MLVASCHCGAVRLTVPRRPRSLTLCNCSICRRLGALWVYYPASKVRVEAAPKATQEYVWGDRTLRFVRCGSCGCVTHWEPLKRGPASRIGVNARNFDPQQIERARIRRLDGASSWKYLD